MENTYPPFLDLPPAQRDPETSRYRILPDPYDETSTFRKGADKGPVELLQVSEQLEEYDIETGLEPCRAGIFVEEPVFCGDSPEQMVGNVQARCAAVIRSGQVPVVIGGEHSVAVGGAWAAAEAFDDVTVVVLDAHGDRRQSYHGSPFNHACVTARIAERSPVLQAGIRSMDASELRGLDTNRVFFAHDIHDNQQWIPQLCALLSPNIYISIDLDVFDPSILPSTGTPQPGGLDWYTVVKLVRGIARSGRIVGFDISELCPDGSHASAMTAAKLLYKTLAYLEENRKI